MEAEAREMSRLAAIAADMSRRAAEAARRSHRTVDAADWSGRAAEAAELSRRATNATEMSRHAKAAWENFLRAGDYCYKRMHAIVHSQMDQISSWARLQDDMKDSLEQAIGVLREGNERLRAEHDLLTAKIVRSAELQEETSALLKRTCVIVKKLMDENAMLRIERQRLVEESVEALKQPLEYTKELIIARREN